MLRDAERLSKALPHGPCWRRKDLGQEVVAEHWDVHPTCHPQAIPTICGSWCPSLPNPQPQVPTQILPCPVPSQDPRLEGTASSSETGSILRTVPCLSCTPWTPWPHRLFVHVLTTPALQSERCLRHLSAPLLFQTSSKTLTQQPAYEYMHKYTRPEVAAYKRGPAPS